MEFKQILSQACSDLLAFVAERHDCAQSSYPSETGWQAWTVWTKIQSAPWAPCSARAANVFAPRMRSVLLRSRGA